MRDFSTVASNSLVTGGQRERLWSKVLSDTPNGRLALFGVNQIRLTGANFYET